MLYLQIFRISFGGRVLCGGSGGGVFAGWMKIGAVVGRRGGLMRRLSAIVARMGIPAESLSIKAIKYLSSY